MFCFRQSRYCLDYFQADIRNYQIECRNGETPFCGFNVDSACNGAKAMHIPVEKVFAAVCSTLQSFATFYIFKKGRTMSNLIDNYKQICVVTPKKCSLPES